jgi:hypothetical protein
MNNHTEELRKKYIENPPEGGAETVYTREEFYEKYVVDSQNPYPDKVRKAIDEIRTILKDIAVVRSIVYLIPQVGQNLL